MSLTQDVQVVDTIEVTGSKMLVRKCKRRLEEGGIFIPDALEDITNWCEVLQVGPECSKWQKRKESPVNPLKSGDFVVLPETGKMWRIEQHHHIVEESEVIACQIDGAFHPFGQRVLLNMIPDEEMIDTIEIPDVAKYRASIGVVVGLGFGILLKTGFVRPFHVKVGDRVMVPISGGLDVTFEENPLRVVEESTIYSVTGSSTTQDGRRNLRSSHGDSG